MHKVPRSSNVAQWKRSKLDNFKRQSDCRCVFINFEVVQIDTANGKYAEWKRVSFEKIVLVWQHWRNYQGGHPSYKDQLLRYYYYYYQNSCKIPWCQVWKRNSLLLLPFVPKINGCAQFYAFDFMDWISIFRHLSCSGAARSTQYWTEQVQVMLNVVVINVI